MKSKATHHCCCSVGVSFCPVQQGGDIRDSLAGKILQLLQEGALPVRKQVQQHRVRMQAQRDTDPNVDQQGDVQLSPSCPHSGHQPQDVGRTSAWFEHQHHSKGTTLVSVLFYDKWEKISVAAVWCFQNVFISKLHLATLFSGSVTAKWEQFENHQLDSKSQSRVHPGTQRDGKGKRSVAS